LSRFFLTGVSHKTAPVEWRERLAVPADRLPDWLRSLRSVPELTEAVAVSTCNRMEVYAVSGEGRDFRPVLKSAMAALHGDPAIADCIYELEGMDAVRHLFRVSSGLESLVVGESEILGQVKRAYEVARAAETTGKLTNVLFQRALYVGKLARVRTGISAGPTSSASLAVALAERIFGDLRECRVLIVGAGEMAELTVRALLSQKVAHLTVVNRTFEKAQELARLYGGEAARLASLAEEVGRADVVICSSASPEPVLRAAEVAEVMRRRRGRSLFLIDIAVPRNVEAAAHDLENVYLYDIDDLQTIVNESLGRRQREIDRAAALAAGQAGEFAGWFDAWRQGTTAALRHSARADEPPASAADPTRS
jgi:glutamyl-tRNA reductase